MLLPTVQRRGVWQSWVQVLLDRSTDEQEVCLDRASNWAPFQAQFTLFLTMAP